MEQRVSLVTLGVSDLARSRAFYEAVGWTSDSDPDGDVVFFQAGGMVVALWDRARLTEDSVAEDAGGYGGVTLAYCTRSPAEVDDVVRQAEEAGATMGRPPADTFWGGYSAIVLDPDGHPWEIAYNPHWTLTENGAIELPPTRVR